MEENSLEQEREIKQTYLRDEIIDKDYSSEDFVLFCEQKKTSDIDE